MELIGARRDKCVIELDGQTQGARAGFNETLGVPASKADKCLPAFSEHLLVQDSRIVDLEFCCAEHSKQIRRIIDDFSSLRSENELSKITQPQIAQPLVINGSSVPDLGAAEDILRAEQYASINEVKQIWQDEKSKLEDLIESTQMLESRVGTLEDAEIRVGCEHTYHGDESPVNASGPLHGNTFQDVSMAVGSTMNKDSIKNSSYTITESTYDACLFIGTGYFSISCSISLGVMSFLCAFMQVTLCWIVGAAMLPPDDFHSRTVDNYRTWRAHVAGRLSYIDPVTGASLGSRVCSPDYHSSLEIASLQADVVDTLHTYLDSTPALRGIAPGWLMCVFAILAWVLAVFNEIRTATDFVRALFQLEYGHLRIVYHKDSSELSLTHVGARRYFMTLAALIKIYIASMLGYQGVRWLLYTPSVSDLLLNACALAFVFDFDELIFNTAAPDALRTFIQSLAPLPIQKTTHVGGMTFFNWCAIVGVMTFIMVVALPVEMDNRQKSLDALCKGYTDFVFGVDNLGFAFWTESRPLSEVSTNSGIKESMLLVADSPTGQTWNKLSSLQGARFSLQSITSLSSSEVAARWNAGCGDIFTPSMPESHTPFLTTFQTLLKNSSFTYCMHLEHRVCNSDSSLGIRARQLCSATCGCRSSISPYPLAMAASGCPITCPHLPHFWDNDYITNCTQMSDATLIAQSAWKKILKYTLNLIYSWPGVESQETTDPYLTLVFAVIANLSTQGCRGITSFRQHIGESSFQATYNLCRGTGIDNIFKPMAVWCPETCECSKFTEACPSSCRDAN